METIFVALALLAGGLLPIQAGANAQLSKSVASPFAATTLQLMVGAAVLLLITTLAGSLAALAGLSDVVWWHAIGGLASALYVVSGILLFPRLGAVVTVGLYIAGQMLASVSLDTSGILGVVPQSFDLATAAGTGAVLLGIIAIVRGPNRRYERTAGCRPSRLGAVGVHRRRDLADSRGGQRATARRPWRSARCRRDQLRRRHCRHGVGFLACGDQHEKAQTSDARAAEDALVGMARRLRRRLLRRDRVYGHSGNRHCCYRWAHDRRATIGLDARGQIRPLASAATAHFETALRRRGAASR